MQRTVDQDDEIEEAQVLRGLDDRPFRRGRRDSVHLGPVMLRDLAPPHIDTPAIVVRRRAVGARDDWKGIDPRQPPSAQAGRSQVREDRALAEHQADGTAPCSQIVELDLWQRDAVDRMCPTRVPQLVARESVLGSVTMANRGHAARIDQSPTWCAGLSTAPGEWRKVLIEWRKVGTNGSPTAPFCATRGDRGDETERAGTDRAGTDRAGPAVTGVRR
ncbi:hypothetical protein EHW97_11705 [Aeromicrobium camelliae]|uniref:Uncharacterized protein n=1 Tax=Aeromicrobium camelliae TaxID=1538144 RepID=A0A3N6W5R5_9ACTN|nr:hypothetical protein [Aeromicrobium camelliae]RQN02879.1 hypothetical protein EHW97_11705 [Aeromicrobium camelliae]